MSSYPLPFFVFAMDPGETTGVCEIVVPQTGPALIVTAYEIPGTPRHIHAAFFRWAENKKASNSAVVCEDWEYRHNTPVDARDACVPIGIIKSVAYTRTIPVKMQLPMLRTTIPNTKIKLEPLGWWLPNLKPHSDYLEAMRHGMAYVTNVMHHLKTIEALHPRPAVRSTVR